MPNTQEAPPRRQKIRRRLIILSGLAFLVLGIAEIYLANSLVAPANHPVGLPPSDMNVVATTIASESGSQLATWYIPADNSHATVVLLHPIRSDRRAMFGRAKLLHDTGYAVVMIDFQAHGESPGEHITIGYLESRDVRAAVDYARSLNPTHRIGIVGWSLGGAATLLASPLNIDAAVLECVYPTLDEAVHNRVAMRLGSLSGIISPVLLWQFQFRLGIAPSELRPIDHITDIGCPVLIAGGEFDLHTSLPETERLFDSVKELKKLSIFKGADHTDLLEQNRTQYEEVVLPFLATYLMPSREDDSDKNKSAP